MVGQKWLQKMNYDHSPFIYQTCKHTFVTFSIVTSDSRLLLILLNFCLKKNEPLTKLQGLETLYAVFAFCTTYQGSYINKQVLVEK